jgi:hypothetical protein
MARATLQKELKFKTKNETGLLGRVTSALAVKGLSITHLSAYSVNGEGFLQTVVADCAKAKEALSHFIKDIEERDVVVVEFENKAGTLASVSKILGNHDIFIDYVYGTSGDGFKIIGVFSTSNNQKAAEVINKES